MESVSLFLLLLFSSHSATASPLNNCPMGSVKHIIQRAALAAKDPATQMQMIRRILEDVHGGTWGVLIVKDPMLVSQDVHWTIPDHLNGDGTPAFCLIVVRKWQYNVFKTGAVDIPDRVTIEDFVSKIRHSDPEMASMKKAPLRISLAEFDKRLARVTAIDDERKKVKVRRKKKDRAPKQRDYSGHA